MKLLLDEMFPHTIATELRRRGHDVDAVNERREFRGRLDFEIFAVAQVENRVIVTENSGDFRTLAAAWIGRGQEHAGFIFTTNRRFPRHDHRTVGRLVRSWDELLSAPPTLTNLEHWLRRGYGR